MRNPALFGVLLALAVTACHSSVLEPLSGTTDPKLLQGGQWSLVTVTARREAPREVSVELTVSFEVSRLSGKAGPNSYAGEYEVDVGGHLDVMGLTTTLIGGPEAEIAGALLVKLSQATAFEVTPGRLRVRTLDGTILDFER
jgi:heat shock protein HslJ